MSNYIRFVPAWLLLAIVMPLSAHAARLYFNPSSIELTSQCTQAISFYIDTQGASSNASDVELSFDPALVEIIDSDAQAAGVQIKAGDAYEYYFGNIVEQGAGRIRIAAAAFSTPFNGNKRFATIELKSKPGVGSAIFSIKFTGAGQSLDSNVAESVSSNDLLTAVTNASLNFVERECTSDTTPPIIQFTTPEDGVSNVATDAPISFTITDAGSGVDISSLQILIDGVVLTSSSPGVTVSGNAASYTIVINQHPPFKSTGSTIRVFVADLAANLATAQLAINFPSQNDLAPPIIEFDNPSNIGSDWNIANPITINLYDLLAGIDISSLEIYINDRLLGSSNYAVTGSKNSYLLVISNYLTSGKLESLRIVVKDLVGNRREARLAAGGGFCPVTTEVNTANILCIGARIPNLGRGVLADLLMRELGGSGVLALLLLAFSVLAATGGRLIWDALVALIDLLAILIGRNLRQASGVVYNRKSYAGVPLALVRVFDRSQKQVATTRSNLQGRYFLQLEPGNYVIEVRAHHFATFDAALKIVAGEQLSLNIPLEHVTDIATKNALLRSYASLFNYLGTARPLLSLLAIISAIAAVVESPRPATISVLTVALATIAMSCLVRLRSGGNSQMLDQQTKFNLPGIGYVLHRANRVVDTGITNHHGRFLLNLEQGRYGIKINSSEYGAKELVSQGEQALKDINLLEIEISKNSGGVDLTLTKKDNN